MAQQGVRFARVHGRIVPIRAGGKQVGNRGKAQLASKFQRHASANKSAAMSDTLLGVFTAVGSVATLEAMKHTKSIGRKSLYAGLGVGGLIATAAIAKGIVGHVNRYAKNTKLAKRFGKRSSV